MKNIIFIISLLVVSACSTKFLDERFDWSKIWSPCKCKEEKKEVEVHFGPGPGDIEDKDENEEKGWLNIW